MVRKGLKEVLDDEATSDHMRSEASDCYATFSDLSRWT